MMSIRIDEAALGNRILDNRSRLLPLAFLFLLAYVFAGIQWFDAALAVALALIFHSSRWDGMTLVWYGIACLVLAAPAMMGPQPWQASGLAFAAYWLVASGMLCLIAAFAMGDGPADAKGNRPQAGVGKHGKQEGSAGFRAEGGGDGP